MTKIALAQPTATISLQAPLDQHPNLEERRRRLETVYNEIVTNGHQSRLAAEK